MAPELTPLAAAAGRRRQAALDRARAALNALEAGGEPVTFQGVARGGRVSRQWLYGQPELRAEIERLRRPVPTAGLAQTRASDASLRQRVQTLVDENRRLREENAALKNELALAYGHQRDHPPLAATPPPPDSGSAPAP